eukprot:CAMPEP_0167743902 /NCGR_PEP_ID=MMETSP0110_2-20121227/2273_1 /TAXON_ID=629695 /ORGANISM="Gymnochlora sp., Strain CCMP2014" /LENGTH=150 /DNA_ID=CAMNT_0007628323 /DNA_START=256 /DNA_END=708 /DNA_ORIENTATION=+
MGLYDKKTFFGTVGTIKVGAVSENCLKDESVDGWTCLPDGVDVTTGYKKKEPSLPGSPTLCGSDKEIAGSFCANVGPFSQKYGSGNYSYIPSSSTILLQSAETKVLVNKYSFYDFGISSSIADPLVNEPGHPLSFVGSMLLRVIILQLLL